MNRNNVFRYTYSAQQNEEVQSIRSKYLPQPESKLDELKRLDHCVQKAGTMQSLVAGLLGGLIFGLGAYLSVQLFAPGCLVGLCGMALMSAAYPVYRTCHRKSRDKYQPRILELIADLTDIKN